VEILIVENALRETNRGYGNTQSQMNTFTKTTLKHNSLSVTFVVSLSNKAAHRRMKGRNAMDFEDPQCLTDD
jgi:hypothetical protein